MDEKAAELRHRIEVRREQLGLDTEEFARRAGMSPRYLEYLTESPAEFDPSALLRVAAVLRMSLRELLEGPGEAAPGQGGPQPHPVLMMLSPTECWDRLGTHGLGRVALPTRSGTGVFLVNYLVEAETIAYRTAPGHAADPEPGSEISFEVDHIDERLRSGWSVLLTGTAERITDRGTIGHLEGEPGAETWTGEPRNRWIRVSPEQITGRTIQSPPG